MKKKPVTTTVVTGMSVGVSGFEPEASWTRTKRDTKLRHTPKLNILYWKKSLMSIGFMESKVK